MNRRVVVTGLSAITPIGTNLNQSWKNMLAGKTGIKRITDDWIKTLKCQLGAPLPETFHEHEYSVKISDQKIFGLVNALAQQLFDDANLDPHMMSRVNRKKFGVSLASNVESLSKTVQLTNKPEKKLDKELVKMNYMIPSSLSYTYGLSGANMVQCFACAAGSMAIGDAYRLVKHGYMNHMITGGADYSCNYEGQINMDILAALNQSSNDHPDTALCSFDEARCGTVLGDGGALLLLEDLESAEKRGAKIYCEILGYAQNCFGKHPTSPEENGNDSYMAAKEALLQSNVTPSELDMINCHASSTIVGDISEARGMRNLMLNKKTFDNIEALRNSDPESIDEDEDFDLSLRSRAPLTALKGNLGHSQLCAGAVETVHTIKMMQDGIMPYIRNLKEPCLDEIDFVMHENQKKELNTVLKTCFGFGSAACSTVFRKL